MRLAPSTTRPKVPTSCSVVPYLDTIGSGTLIRTLPCPIVLFPINSYKVEWDAIGLEGYRNGGSPSDSLLYSSVDIQAVEVSASKNDLGGHFSLAYR